MFFARKIEKETCPSIHPSHILDLVKTSYDPESKSTLNSYNAKRKKEKGRKRKRESGRREDEHMVSNAFRVSFMVSFTVGEYVLCIACTT